MSKDSLMTRIMEVLEEVDGYLVLHRSSGREYVIMSKQDFEQRSGEARERQLHLLTEAPRVAASADAMLDKINRDIALYQIYQEEPDEEVVLDETLPLEPAEALSALDDEDDLGLTMPTGGRRIRFESLRGDLPPDLQE